MHIIPPTMYEHNLSIFRLLLLALFILPMVTVIILTKVSYSYQAWEMTPHLYFRRAGEREHKFYTKLLVNNNTGKKKYLYIQYRESPWRKLSSEHTVLSLLYRCPHRQLPLWCHSSRFCCGCCGWAI